MTRNPAYCAPEPRLSEAAKLMADHDCGELPVLDEAERPIGVVSDRDICCRGIAHEEGLGAVVREVKAQSAVTTPPETGLHDCFRTLEGIKSAGSQWWTRPESAARGSHRPTLRVGYC
jgi:CBS domain-containing protein